MHLVSIYILFACCLISVRACGLGYVGVYAHGLDAGHVGGRSVGNNTGPCGHGRARICAGYGCAYLHDGHVRLCPNTCRRRVDLRVCHGCARPLFC